MRTILMLPLLVAAGTTATPAQSQVASPPGWRWTTDQPARHTTGEDLPENGWRFVAMAPGWHITTRPGAVLFDPGTEATGRYSLESVQILFPGTSQSGYGLLFGGRDLEGPGQSYLTFLARRDGYVTVEARRNEATTTLLPWTATPAVKRVGGDSTARNVLRVTVERDSLLFDVNAIRVAALSREGLVTDGSFGFRTGGDLNLHITTLDYTRRLAPFPRRN
jgi:hypothetical protein